MDLDLVTGMGRLNRIRFLAYTNISILTCMAIGFVIAMLIGSEYRNYLSLVIAIILVVISTKFAAQRYRDVAVSGWWALFCLTPGSPIIYIMLALISGTPGDNKYGPQNPDTNLLLKLLAVIPTSLYFCLLIWWNFYI